MDCAAAEGDCSTRAVRSAVGEGARGFAHPDDGAGEEQDEDEGGEAADGDGDGELREGEVEEAPAARWVQVGGRGLMPDVDVARAVGSGDGDEPEPAVVEHAAVDAGGGEVGEVGERGRGGGGADGLAVGVEESGAGGLVAGGVVAEGGAAAGGEVGEGGGGVVAEIVVEGVGDDVGTGEVLTHEEGGGDDEDEALGEPEDGEDF